MGTMARRLDPSTPQGHRHDYVPPPYRDRRPQSVSRPEPDAAFADDDVVRPDDVSIDEVVERLSRDISDAVNRAPFDERDELRSYASEIVREDTAPPRVEARPPARRERLSFFAVAVWLAVAGAVLAVVLPPAGIICFLMAGVAAVLAVILGPADALVDRTAAARRAPRVTQPPA
jgi:hypothetical protein